MRGLAAHPRRAVTRLAARTPLRIRLLAAALTLVALALAVISFVGITVFRHYLLHQADQQLKNYAQVPRVHRIGGGPLGMFLGNYGLESGFGARSGPGGILTEVIGQNGQLFGPLVPGQDAGSLPAIPVASSWLKAHTGQLVTLPYRSGSGQYRVIVQPGVCENPTEVRTTCTLVVGVDLGSIGQTIGTLTAIDLAVSGAVLVIVAGVGVALIRASLRPLAQIEQTAGAIAAGDLSRRVPDRDPRTEVGSLASSLNLMLSQIEHAFHARSASEATARRSEERMRRFIADASHELRTPLSVIRGFAEYHRQRGGLTGDELDRMVRRVEDEATRMGLLVEDLLLLARLDQQRPLQRRPVDMLALTADAVHDARVLAPDRDIELNVGSGGAFLVLGDEPRLRQVIANLVSNALTHTPEASPVELRLRTGHGESGAVVTLEVADAGHGLTAEQADRVFERFYRTDAARARKTGGTGLGLAIVAALTAVHGGTAAVRTAPGEGATFVITLPLAPEAADIADSPGTAADEPNSGEATWIAADASLVAEPPRSAAAAADCQATVRQAPAAADSEGAANPGLDMIRH
jgi:two-component system, OmpR family, sensor kinase